MAPRRLPGGQSRIRKSLSQVGGRTTKSGSPAESAALARWFGAATTDDGQQGMHGFHAYPARMHPSIVRAALSDLPTHRSILDPFCGSGTTLVEGMLAGRPTYGSDINPLAVALSQLKTTIFDAAQCKALATIADEISARSAARVKHRVSPTRRFEFGDKAEAPFEPHVALELAGLSEEIAAAKAPPLTQKALELVLSSILVKVSRQRSDASAGQWTEKKIGKTLPSQLFARKAEELSRRLSEFSAAVPSETPRAKIVRSDARALSFAPNSIDLVVTSPPYFGTYDYLRQHELRLKWLGLKVDEAAEIGARRRASREDLETFTKDLRKTLEQIARVLRQEGIALLMVGDTAAYGQRISADELIASLAKEAGLVWVATASQKRQPLHSIEWQAFAEEPKREHFIWLARAPKV